jgi:serine/threonine protein kinase
VVGQVDVKQLSEVEKDAAADEIYKLSAVQHPCCTPIYDVFVDNSAICIVMGFVPGSSLAAVVQQASSQQCT